MDKKTFPPLVGVKVTVEVPEGLPELMFNVTREVLRNEPEDEKSAYSIIADYLECLLKERRENGDSIDVVTNLNEMNEERYIEKLIESGYTREDLDKMAGIIQREWKRYKIRKGSVDKSGTHDYELSSDVITENVIKTLESRGVTLKMANEAVIKIQRAWKKYHKSVSKRVSFTPTPSVVPKQFEIKSVLDFIFENDSNEVDNEDDSDDSERVNVVKKWQRDYVPPIPDFIENDFDSFKGEHEDENDT